MTLDCIRLGYVTMEPAGWAGTQVGQEDTLGADESPIGEALDTLGNNILVGDGSLTDKKGSEGLGA